MPITEAVIAVALAFLIALFGTARMRAFALKAGLIDRPSSRSSHSTPTPRGGGLAIVAAFLAALLGLYARGYIDARIAAALIGGGCGIAVVGFVDDRRSVPARVRFLVHLGSAALAVGLIGGVPMTPLGHFGEGEIWLSRLIAVVAIAWAINLFNFMDGIDGIAGAQAVFMSSAGAGLNFYLGGDSSETVAMLCVGSASLGFLVWNWPPAKIFMGDVGSGFLGFSLAGLGLAASRRNHAAVAVWLILGGVFLADASVTLARRMARGDRWFEAHRMHAYQHLARRWHGHLPVTLVVNAVNVGWLLPWAICAAAYPTHGAAIVTAALLPLVFVAVIAGAGTP